MAAKNTIYGGNYWYNECSEVIGRSASGYYGGALKEKKKDMSDTKEKVTSCGGSGGKFFGFVHVGKQLIYATDASGYMAFSDEADAIKKAVCNIIQKNQYGTGPGNSYKAYVIDAVNNKVVATLGTLKVVEVPWEAVK